MKKLISLLLSSLLIFSLCACESENEVSSSVGSSSEYASSSGVTTSAGTSSDDVSSSVVTSDNTISSDVSSTASDPSSSPSSEVLSSTVSGTADNDDWEPEEGVDYSKYDFLGRGEELVKEVDSKYSGYTVKYILDGRTVSRGSLDSLVNLMAYYNASSSNKTVTVNIDTIEVRVQCEYTSLTAAAGEFIVVEFTTNLPTVFIGSIGAKGSAKGEVCHEGIIPTGSNGTYKGKIKLTVPFVKAGNYFFNISIDSGNAGFPHLMSIPIKITEGERSDSQFKLLFAGDWDLITAKGYKDSLEKLFYNCYPRIYSRFAFGSEPKTITFVADKNYDGVAYAVGTMIVVSVDYANSNPRDIGFFSHEITHSAQQYGDKLNYGGDAWWTENMANYGGFRYFHWSSAEYVQIYKASDGSLQDWGYEAYGNNKWFFAYMDAKYPTKKNPDGSLTYGLIDSINRLIKNNSGSQLNDDPYDTSSKFNQTVKAVTGYDCIESLRLKFVEELKNGTWEFVGFGNYSDNFITENLPGVENPDYPMITSPVHGNKTASSESAYTSGTNLCKGATVYAVSGQVNSSEKGEKLIDGKENTKWCSTTDTTKDPMYSLDGTRHWIIIDLGSKKTFDTYTIYNTNTKEGYGNMTEWEVLVSNDAKNWTSVDYQPSCNKDKASFNIGEQSARYVMLRVYNPDNNEAGTIRLYEFMLFDR